MKLTPVESSHIAAIGYLDDECVIFLRYRDGTLYAMPGMPPRVWDALCAAESKGRYVERLREPMVRILKGGSTGDREPEQQCGAASIAAPLESSSALTVADMRKHQKPTSAADCAVAVVR